MGLRKVALVGAVAALAVVGGVIAYAARQPDGFVIGRSVTIAAPTGSVYRFVGTISEWESWSPWKARDPALTSSYEGPATGAGATWIWTSLDGGSGRMTLTEASPESGVRYQMSFLGYSAESTGALTLSPDGNGTRATWTLSGRNSLIDKVVWLIFGMESSLAVDFEDGLARLKKLAEN
jgi:hypothetical protein